MAADGRRYREPQPDYNTSRDSKLEVFIESLPSELGEEGNIVGVRGDGGYQENMGH